MERISKENYYLDIAETVLERATCLRRVYGAIIVKNDEIISTGYNGAPRGRKNCVDMGFCTREAMQVPRGQRYELWRFRAGRQNFVRSGEDEFGEYEVSQMLFPLSEPVHGVIFDPLRNELFTASRGAGAVLNDKKIRVADRKDLAGTVVCTGFPPRERARASAQLRAAQRQQQNQGDDVADDAREDQ